MSERSSFVTEYIYCEECFARLSRALLRSEKYLAGQVIDPFKIIAGKIGSLGPLGEAQGLEDEMRKEDFPCHPVRLAIIHDQGSTILWVIHPDGWIDIAGGISKEVYESAVRSD